MERKSEEAIRNCLTYTEKKTYTGCKQAKNKDSGCKKQMEAKVTASRWL